VDPDARQGKKTNNSWPGYKAHIVMEEETGIITGVETTPANATDGSQLKPMLKKQAEVYSLKPQELTADKAYDWGENLESLASNQTICLQGAGSGLSGALLAGGSVIRTNPPG
jgi:IS5 family transposase